MGLLISFVFLQQRLITTKEELKHKSQQIDDCNLSICHLTDKLTVLSSSLHEKETTISQLQNAYQQVTSIPQQLSEEITLTTQIAELKQRLQEAEYQKQQVVLERESAVQEYKAMKILEMQLHKRVGKLQLQLFSLHVSPQYCVYTTGVIVCFIDKPPEITNHPKSLKEVTPGKTVEFTIQSTGTEPLSYLWKWKPAVREHGSEEWQPCDTERFSGAESSLLTILDVQKWNEGSYCCVVHNYAGNRTSKPATITVGKNTNTHMLTFVTIISTSAISLHS